MNEFQILDSEIEALVNTKNSLIKETNALKDEQKRLENECRETQIRTQAAIDNEKQRLKQINAEFLQELSTKEAFFTKKEEWIFVLLSYLGVTINKSFTLTDMMELWSQTISDLQERLIKEIGQYKVHNREVEAKFTEADKLVQDLKKMSKRQEEINENVVKFKHVRETLRIDQEKIEREKELLEKKNEFFIDERQRIDNEWAKIKAQWKMLENTKNYLH